MSDLVIQRKAPTEFGTAGLLMNTDGDGICFTLEPVSPVIPAGTYKFIPHDGPEWKGVWEIIGIKGHSALLIHAGNTIKDTHGCVLVGMDQSAKGVWRSQEALDMLRGRLPKEGTITIKDAANVG